MEEVIHKPRYEKEIAQAIKEKGYYEIAMVHKKPNGESAQIGGAIEMYVEIELDSKLYLQRVNERFKAVALDIVGEIRGKDGVRLDELIDTYRHIKDDLYHKDSIIYKYQNGEFTPHSQLTNY